MCLIEKFGSALRESLLNECDEATPLETQKGTSSLRTTGLEGGGEPLLFVLHYLIYRSVEVFSCVSCSDNTCQPVNLSFKPRAASTSCCPLWSGMVAMAFRFTSPRGSDRTNSEQDAIVPTGIPFAYTTTS